MHSLSQLQKQQIGLRLPQYLIEEIDSFTKEFSVNRTDIVTEALRAYLAEQRSKLFYERFDHAAKEAKQMIDADMHEGTLEDLIDELEADTHA